MLMNSLANKLFSTASKKSLRDSTLMGQKFRVHQRGVPKDLTKDGLAKNYYYL